MFKKVRKFFENNMESIAMCMAAAVNTSYVPFN